MKKLLIVVLAGTVLTIAQPAYMQAAEGASSPSGATFELTYRGLAAPDDPLSYRSYWGFGGASETDSSFIADVKKRVEQYDLVYNSMLPEEVRWSLVELKEGKPVAFYFDTDGDGEFSDDERFLPAQPQGPDFGYDCAFITSDFMTRGNDRKETPFRAMLVAPRSSAGGSISYMWSPCCVLEGEATLAGEPTKMIMYADGFRGSFSTFRGCSVALFAAGQKVEGYLSRQSLSSLIYYQDTFYRLKLVGTHAQGETLSVVLTEDTTPTGRVEVDLTGSQTLKGRLMSAAIEGAEDDTIYFNVVGGRTTFPAGAYRLASGYVTYGTASDNEWRVNFSDGPAFDVAAEDTRTIKLGELTLSVNAVKPSDRYRTDVEATSTFPKGTALYIEPKIAGKAGEAYLRFTQRGAQPSQPNRFGDVKPHLRITDPDGEEIVSTDLEYG